ncbi:NUDIX hydrolase [Chryseosolibacter indicus]|uniref:NUDIX hydrolase n=1 Tax=Chryseosolibacter indicus TaxID=2782351 RepID=A0ABS5VNZ7_9BACT|nr:NUDIX hydrolase [Chryseosolibacter indicus]MBT1702499.1 NUDIX hydrolase [Chryseosolibacter indicus]
MKTRLELIQAVKLYRSTFEEELLFKKLFIDLLNNPRAYHRDHLPGHITGSAFIVDSSRKYVLLTHHAKLNKWLQPGGHADGDENVINVALREADEETGLKNLRLITEEIFDLDVHAIPARKDFPQHDHYDVRILLEGSREEQLIITEESKDLAWVSIDEAVALSGNNHSIARMVEKVKLM